MTHADFAADSIDGFIDRQLPDWLTRANTDHLLALRRAMRRQQRVGDEMAALLQAVPDLLEFAMASLGPALQAQAMGSVDVRTCRVLIEQDITLPTAAPRLPAPRYTHHSTQNLLAAALHNYHEEETSPSMFRRARLVDAGGQTLPLAFEPFCRLCRRVDVGGQYQARLKAVLRPADSPGQPLGYAAQQVTVLFQDQARVALEVAVRIATLQGELDEDHYYQLLPLFAPAPLVPAVPGLLTACQVYLLGKRLNGVVALELRAEGQEALQGVICWIPGDSYTPVAWYASWAALFEVLGGRVSGGAYRAFISRLVSERDRPAFVATLARRARSTPRGSVVELDGRYFALDTPLFAHLATVRMDTLLDDARVLAVPTGDEDAASRRERLQGYLEAGLDLLSLAGLFVPVLGEALLAVAAVQIAEQVYEGYQDWRLGDREAALDHLFNVAQTVVVGAATGAAGAGALRVVQRSAFVDSLAPLRRDSGAMRLCAADLGAYRVSDSELAVGQQVRAPGGWRLRTHEAAYQALEDGTQGGWTLRHPTRAPRHAARVEHNGSGGWRHEFEEPQHWPGLPLLMRRLASRLAAIDDSTALALSETTGFDHARLRRLHVESAAVPARLVDALERRQLHLQYPLLRGAAFEEVVAERQRVADRDEALLLRDFPGLTMRGAAQVLSHASEVQLTALRVSGRVPLALAERARWFVRDSRIDRACAGLSLPQAVNSDTELLAVRMIEALAPWPPSVRLTLRQGSESGPVRVAVGDAQAERVLTVISGRRSYRLVEDGAAGAPGGLLQTLLRTLDTTQQQRLAQMPLGEPGLASRLMRAASADREQVAAWLGMAPVGLGVRPPLRFADGRLGYSLSGRAEGGRQAIRRGIHQIFPTLTGMQLDAYVLELMASRVDLWQHYLDLQGQLGRLRTSLQAWRNQSGNPLQALRRTRVATALRRCWRRKLTDVAGDFILDIDGEHVGSLPSLPADIRFTHVRRLRLRDLTLTELDADFLPRFPSLVELDLRDNRLTDVPAGVEGLTQLRQLHLSNNRIVMDLASSRRLSSLVRLHTLDLGNNPLRYAPDLEGLRHLRHVSLRSTGLRNLPEPLRQLSWRGFVDMRENRLSSLRDDLRALRSRLSLHDNPLDETSEARLDEAAGIDPSTSRGSAAYRHASVSDELRELWLGSETGEIRAAHTTLWNNLHQEPGSSDLFRFLADFAETEDFSERPGHYRKRIWHILKACSEHESLRLRLFREAGGPRTCEDRLLLVLSQLEVAILAEQASLSGGVASERNLVMLGLSLWRLDEVDRIATAHVNTLRSSGVRMLDEVEVRLYYRVELARPLGLPSQPSGMHYESFANVSREDLSRARKQVLANESSAVVIDSLAARPYWQGYVRKRFTERFEQLAAPFHERLDGYLQTVEQSGEQAYLERSNALMRELEAAEQVLTGELTEEAYERTFPG